jgi:hypothetical protein
MPTNARSIQFPVGKEGLNKAQDVSVIQSLLNGALERESKFRDAGIKKLKVDGKCGPLTCKAIQAFQEKVLGWSGKAVDGTVHPDRMTWRALNGNVGSTQKIKVSSVARSPKIIEGYNAFRQGDARWGSQHLGTGQHTIHQWGCAMCTLTMAASVIGSPTASWPDNLRPKDLTPSITNGILVSAGAFSGSCLDMPKAANALGMTYDEYGRTAPLEPGDVAIIQAHIQNGYPVAAHVAYGDTTAGCHWIVIIRRHGDGSYGCIDPAYGDSVKLSNKPARFATATSVKSTAAKKTESAPQGVLYGFGNGGSPQQQQYVVVRFACLSPATGGFCSANG